MEEVPNRFIAKETGELGGVGCDEDEAGVCDLEFAVVQIEPAARCEGAEPAPGTQFVRFTVDATTRGAFAYPGRLIGGVLEARNWGVVDAAGSAL